MLLLIILFSLLCAIFYVSIYMPLNYWKDRGVPHLKPILGFGNFETLKAFLGRISFQESFMNIHYLYPDKRYCGFYLVTKPFLDIRDLDLIKDIWVRHYDHFINHVKVFGEDGIVGKSILAARGEHWKNLRSTLSPAFSSGKLKGMYPLIEVAAKNFVNHFSKPDNIYVINARETLSKFSSDSICSTSFGVECNSFEDENNELYKMGKRLTKSSGFQAAKVFFSMTMPNLMKFLKIPIFSKNLIQYYHDLIKSNIAQRKRHGIVRPDLIHMLMEASEEKFETCASDACSEKPEDDYLKMNEKLISLIDDDIIAQVIVFYFAGMDTTSIQLSFLCYELASNMDIQNKLRREIQEALDNGNGSISYEKLHNLKYMDMVVCEAMRKWPPPHWFTRECNKEFIIEPKLPGESELKLKVGDTVSISLLAIHRNPKYFPDPEKFDPERFSDENKDQIVPYSFLPFSAGPRNCIASRLALLTMKTFLVHLMANFELLVVEKTPKLLKFQKFSITNDGKHGIWLGLRRL